MWSQIALDASIQKNFNVGFGSHKNDVHIHLSEWQYWWWYWFALLWALYFIVIIRIVNSRSENFNLVINTSLRSHGKWGDFLVALIPLSWCGNILINSNFILRMIEWQAEGSLMVIRVQGKQWYWVYKYNSDTTYRLQNIYRNIGNNNWIRVGGLDKYQAQTHQSNLFYIQDLEFKKMHKIILDKHSKDIGHIHKLHLNSQFTNYDLVNKDIVTNIDNTKINLLKNNTNIKANIIFPQNIEINYNVSDSFLHNKSFNLNPTKEINKFHKNIAKQVNFILYNESVEKSSHYEETIFDNTEETSENLRIKQHKYPIRLVKGIINKHNFNILTTNKDVSNSIFFKIQVNNSDVASKISQTEEFWGFRQKKYKKLKSYSFVKHIKYDNTNYQPIKIFQKNIELNKYFYYGNVKNNKHKNELIPITLARRLLRTKRTLVLPAHINITVITNSYDVVHSWFIPGLGLKLDCVPGRSTHHTFYIDNIGFYYGQCAEICGRYHHHMPIRVCALKFEHFLVWWQTRGLPRMHRSEIFTKSKSQLLNKFKYNNYVFNRIY